MRYISFFVFLLTLLLSSKPVVAKIQEADSTIVDRATVRTIEAFPQTALNIPDELQSDKDIFVLAQAGAAYTNVRVLARPTVDEKKLARDLEEAIRSTNLAHRDVVYDKDDDYSAAMARYSEGHIGAKTGQNSFAFGVVVDALRDAGYTPHVLISVPLHVTTSVLDLPREQRPRTIWYDATKARRDQSVTLQAKMSASAIWQTAGFLLFVPVIGVISILAAILYGCQQQIPVNVRRQLYPKLATWPTFGAIAIHFPFVLFYLRSANPRLLGDLWFGSTTISSVFFPILMLGPLVMMMLLPLSGKLERRLFGPVEDTNTAESVPPPAPISPEEKRVNQQIGYLTLLPTAVSAVLLVISMIAPIPRATKNLIIPVAMAISIGGPALVRILLQKRLKQVQVQPLLDVELTDRAAHLAERMAIPSREVKIDDSENAKHIPGAVVNGAGLITVTRRLKDILEPAELDFILAHELAHRSGKHLLRQQILMGLALALCLVPGVRFLASTVVLAGSPLDIAFMVTPFVGILLLVLGTQWLQRKREHEADLLALRVTGDITAAVGALNKLVANSPLPHIHEVGMGTHPAMSKRIAALRSSAATLGLSEKSL